MVHVTISLSRKHNKLIIIFANPVDQTGRMEITTYPDNLSAFLARGKEHSQQDTRQRKWHHAQPRSPGSDACQTPWGGESEGSRPTHQPWVPDNITLPRLPQQEHRKRRGKGKGVKVRAEVSQVENWKVRGGQNQCRKLKQRQKTQC